MSIKIGQKNYQLKIFAHDTYGNSAVPESAIADARIFSYSQKLNAGMGVLQFQLERTIQDWNTAGDIEKNKVVELWVNDIDTSDYVRVYVGYVSDIQFLESRDKRTMDVTCLGFVSRLSRDILKNGTQTTLYGDTTTGLSTGSPSTSADPSLIFKAIVDRLRNSADGNIDFLNYGSAPNETVEDTDLAIETTFKQNTYLEALEECRKLAPANWFWNLDENNNFHFKRKPSKATHNFSFGNISILRVNDTMRDVINGVLLFDNDATYRYLEDSNSVANYGRRIERRIVPNADDTEAMDKVANSILGEFSQPRAIIQITVSDNNEGEATGGGVTAGYDIESIKVGETCRISGINEVAGVLLSDNMTILNVETQPTKAILDVEVRHKQIGDILIEDKKEQEDINKSGIPATYTAV